MKTDSMKQLIFRTKIYPLTLAFLCFFTLFQRCASNGSLSATEAGQDFIAEAKWLYTVMACGQGKIPEGVDPKDVEAHCKSLEKKGGSFKKNFLDKFIPFFNALRPANLPKTVLYPFGGSDLFTALAAYPGATEIITLSLETSGDPRKLTKAQSWQIRQAMSDFRKVLGNFYLVKDNSNDNVRALEKGIIPSQVTMSLAAAAFYGYEPVSLRYFRIEPDGKIHYLTKEDIASLEKVKGPNLPVNWQNPDFSVAFRSMEILYRPGEGSKGRAFIHRHISANVHNSVFDNSPLQKYLQSKGKIAAMTKGGSYLLWMNGFSALRKVLLDQMVFMVSDSTGILPQYAGKAGFEQVTYGTFHAAFLDNDGGEDAETLKAFFKSQPFRPLSFRFGHSDKSGANHLIITAKPGLLKK